MQSITSYKDRYERAQTRLASLRQRANETEGKAVSLAAGLTGAALAGWLTARFGSLWGTRISAAHLVSVPAILYGTLARGEYTGAIAAFGSQVLGVDIGMRVYNRTYQAALAQANPNANAPPK